MGSDRISALPDCLITQILFRLPTKDSVKTSVLSSRWRNQWVNVPGLELQSNDFPYLSKAAIKNFTDRFLELNRDLSLQKFKIKYDESNMHLFVFSEWIATVINRGVQHLDVDTLRRPFTKYFMHVDIYKSKTLVSLKLVNVGLPNPEFAVSLPCLKIMHLENILCGGDDPLIMEKLISGCPVLQDLTVCRNFDDNVPVLRVRSQTLKRFWVRSVPGSRGDKEYAIEIEIDAPGLEYMNYKDQSERIVVRNLSSLFMNTYFLGKEKGTIHDFLTGISKVRHMIISQPTLKVLLHHDLKLGLISKFHNVCHLEASFCYFLLKALPNFLESFPNLKHLTLCLHYMLVLGPENLELTNGPQCLLLTLECVEIKEATTKDTILMRRVKTNKETAMSVAEHKKKIWMQVVKYFLENSVALKKLTLYTNQDSDITKELTTFTKRSRRCQIIFR